MEDSFRVRVDKAFGSLAAAASSSTTTQTANSTSSSLSSLWCLTDDEVERNQWRQDKESPEPEHPDPYQYGDLRSEMEKDLEDLEDEEAQSEVKHKPDDYNDEEWEIKKSIGFDCTLDYEQEEDEYDKVAVGYEKNGDRLYINDVNDYGIDIDSNNVLPNSLMDVTRDPRANHLAAKIRLKEDAEAAQRMDSLRVTEGGSSAIVNDETNNTFEDTNLKSILKRKDDQLESELHDNQLASKSQKRVRFDPECKDADEECDTVADIQMETDKTREDMVYHLPSDYPSGIPDYMRNPSKYTHYTFDSSTDIDEESNQQAYMDFLKILKRLNATESKPDDASVGLPKSLTFIPKKRTGDATMTDNCTDLKENQDGAGKESRLKRVVPVGIAAGDVHDNETCAMEEDEPEKAADMKNRLQRTARQYRTKTELDADEPV